MLYRSHRELLEDSMKTIVEVKTFRELLNVIQPEIDWMGKEKATVELKEYTYDDRIGWKTFCVAVNGCAIGFTNGPLKEFPDIDMRPKFEYGPPDEDEV